jgi:hypothetical protein
VIRQDGRIVAEHPRSFGRGDTLYDPWHYVPVLARKPGALRNGAPFKDWVLPAAMERVRRKLATVDDGNRQMVDILTAVLTEPRVDWRCSTALRQAPLLCGTLCGRSRASQTSFGLRRRSRGCGRGSMPSTDASCKSPRSADRSTSDCAAGRG